MTTPTGGDDREIRFTISTEIEDANRDIEEFRTAVSAVKTTFKELQETTDGTFREISKVIKDNLQEIKAVTSEGFKVDIGRDAYKEAIKQLQEENKALIDQERQGAAQRKAELQQQVTLIKDVQTAERTSAKQREAEIKQQILLSKELEAAQKSSFQGAKSAAEEYKQRIIQIKNELLQLKNAGFTLEEAAKGLVDSGRFKSSDVTKALKEIQAEAKNTQGAIGGLISSFTNLGTVAKFVFGSILGVTVVGIIRSLIGYFKDAIQSGIEFTQSVFKLAASTNALRRVGVDVTFAGIAKQIENIRAGVDENIGEIGRIFSRKQLVEGIANIQLLTRELGLNKEQIDEVTKASAGLAVLFGKDLGEAARQIGLAISSGYSEALQRAGFNINKVTIAQKAMALGLGDSFQALDGTARATATLALINEQLVNIYPDLAAYIDTTTGKISIAQASFEDLTATIGTRFLPTWADLLEQLGKAADIIQELVDVYGRLDVAVFRATAMFYATAEALHQAIFEGKNYFEVLKELQDQINKDYELRLKATFPEQFGIFEQEADLGAQIDTAASKRLEIETDLREAIEKETERLANKLRDLEEDKNRDLAEIALKGKRKLLEIERDYADDLEKIDRDLAQDQAKAQRKLYDDLAKIEREYQRDLQEARDDFREGELEAERRFQQDLRKLRDQLIFDLEEAVRNRDASQIRTILRRYEFDREQLIKSQDDAKQERRRAFEQELEDIRRQREEKIRERRISFTQELEELRIQADIRRREAAIKLAEEKADLARQLQQQRADRLRQYQEQIADAKQAAEDRIAEVARGLLGELDITYEIAQQIYDALKEYFGENGLVDALYSEMQRMIIENLNQTSQQVNTWATGVVEQIRKLFSQLSETSNQFSTPVPPQLIPPGSTSPFSSNLPGYQEGGTLVATKPTVAVFGEIPEIVTFTPINRRGANQDRVFGGNLPGNLGTQQQILLDILLSPDLEVRMKDQISNDLADVVVEVNKYRR